MQAITVKYLPATNYKGSRLKAFCEAGSLTVDYDHGAANPYFDVAKALARKLKWTGHLIEGGTSKARVYVFMPAQYVDAIQAGHEFVQQVIQSVQSGSALPGPYIHEAELHDRLQELLRVEI